MFDFEPFCAEKEFENFVADMEINNEAESQEDLSDDSEDTEKTPSSFGMEDLSQGVYDEDEEELAL